MNFPTDYRQILDMIEAIDPIAYGKTRNYLDGAVTRLSPYISRGVVSTRQVAERLLQKGYAFSQMEVLLKELAWRDYFQQVWIALGEKINEDVRHPQPQVRHTGVPPGILNAATGITVIDQAISSLYETGYLHNHLRMYIAAITCNAAGSHWNQPAKWMYYHLLDADWASNALSWQWVAGSFSNKKYMANQENINKYSGLHQQGTFLDMPYERLGEISPPPELSQWKWWEAATILPSFPDVQLNHELPTYIYNFYNLDPNWDASVPANRILLLEPSFFLQYPVCSRTMDFILALAKNIEGIQVFCGSFQSLFSMTAVDNLHYKEHPTNAHYIGMEHSRDWLFPEVQGYYPSFFNFWKRCLKTDDYLTERSKTT